MSSWMSLCCCYFYWLWAWLYRCYLISVILFKKKSKYISEKDVEDSLFIIVITRPLLPLYPQNTLQHLMNVETFTFVFELRSQNSLRFYRRRNTRCLFCVPANVILHNRLVNNNTTPVELNMHPKAFFEWQKPMSIFGHRHCFSSSNSVVNHAYWAPSFAFFHWILSLFSTKTAHSLCLYIIWLRCICQEKYSSRWNCLFWPPKR